MKKLFLLFVLLAGCSNVHGVKVSKDLDASVKDVSVSPSDGGMSAQSYCNTWCHHLASNIDADNQCVSECKSQYPECTVNDQ